MIFKININTSKKNQLSIIFTMGCIKKNYNLENKLEDTTHSELIEYYYVVHNKQFFNYNFENVKINIEDDEYNKYLIFAEQCYETNKDEYHNRNQFNKSKIILDIIIGKLGEIGVYNYLTKEKQWLCKYPDFKIYSKENKNFDSDICSDKYNIHVKSQSLNSAEKFGESWQFQKKDKLTYNPEKNDLIFLTIISEKIVEIKKIVLALDIISKYKEPILEKLKHTKKTLYLKDI